MCENILNSNFLRELKDLGFREIHKDFFLTLLGDFFACGLNLF